MSYNNKLIIVKAKLKGNFKLNNCGSHYTISNNGRDVFYYFKNSDNRWFPHKLSLNFDDFNDDLVRYCEWKLEDPYISEEKLEFYLIKLFNRIVNYKNVFEKYKVDDYLLDKNGKFNLSVFNYDIKLREKVFSNLPCYYQLNAPYSANQNWHLFSLMIKSGTTKDLYRDVAELSRDEFEKELCSEELKFEYVEHYGENNRFYFEFVDENDDAFNVIKIVFYIVENNKIKLFFCKDNYH